MPPPRSVVDELPLTVVLVIVAIAALMPPPPCTEVLGAIVDP